MKCAVAAQLLDVLIEFKQQCADTDESVLVPFEALADFEAKSDDAVTLAPTAEVVEARGRTGPNSQKQKLLRG